MCIMCLGFLIKFKPGWTISNFRSELDFCGSNMRTINEAYTKKKNEQHTFAELSFYNLAVYLLQVFNGVDDGVGVYW